MIERLDMRIGDAHILASESSHAIGRYLTDGQTESVCWMCIDSPFIEPTTATVAIEITTPQILMSRLPENSYMYFGDLGYIFAPLGVALATNNRMTEIHIISTGFLEIETLRRLIGKDSSAVASAIGGLGQDGMRISNGSN